MPASFIGLARMARNLADGIIQFLETKVRVRAASDLLRAAEYSA
jgi:hypothetical protein